jgi:hypothetical protein
MLCSGQVMHMTEIKTTAIEIMIALGAGVAALTLLGMLGWA